MNLAILFVKISSMRVNIFKSFELFLSQPLSIIRDRIIQICHVEAEGVDVSNKVEFNLSDESTQINVYNSPKMYNLLTSVIHKKKRLSVEQKDDSKKSKVHS